MLIFKLLEVVFLLYNFSCIHGMKTCASPDDCIDIRECPAVTEMETQKAVDIVKKITCDIVKVEGKRRIIKICCSEVAPDFQYRQGVMDDPDTNIENHPNIMLLPDTCGRQFLDRIIGGSDAGIYEFPWMTLLYIKIRDSKGNAKRKFTCGGSIINSKYILTAAHCVQSEPVVGVRVGEYDIRTKEDCQGQSLNFICENHIQDIRIERKIVHEDYAVAPRVINDIALLRVKKEIDFSYKNVKPICLPLWKNLRSVNLNGTLAMVAGWGTTETAYTSPVLQKVTIPISTDSNCTQYLERYSDLKVHKNFCAGSLGKDSCRGDSGGPLMLFDNYNNSLRMIQYGIVSYGPNQCGSERPGVYTDVSKYMKWILDNIES